MPFLKSLRERRTAFARGTNFDPTRIIDEKSKRNGMITETPLGYMAAVRVLRLGRSAFFGGDKIDLPRGRGMDVAKDDLIPQFGYIGENYHMYRVLMLGINPGNGDDNKRSSSDSKMMPILAKFAKDLAQESFVDAQNAYRENCQKWAIWKRHCSEVFNAGKLSLGDVAYTNCLPWRTDSESNFSDHVAAKSLEIYVNPLLDEIMPTVVIAMGKKVEKILAMSNRKIKNIIVWNRAQAPTPSVLNDRQRAANEIFRIIQAR